MDGLVRHTHNYPYAEPDSQLARTAAVTSMVPVAPSQSPGTTPGISTSGQSRLCSSLGLCEPERSRAHESSKRKDGCFREFMRAA